MIGVALWFATILFWVLLFIFTRHHEGEPDRISDETFLALLWSTILFQAACFFWGGYHLTQAKGYPTPLIILGLFPCLQPVILTVLLVLEDKCAQPSNRRRPQKARRSYESEIGRIIRYRRNALVGNSAGLFGIFAGAVVTLFPAGFAADPDTAVVTGIFIFLAGYAGVIAGCWWWAKAKAWNEAVVFIGLMPLAILLIPWVRLIYIAIPALLPTAMIMMPLILLVVMFALPDKSGMSTRKPWDLSKIGNREHRQ